MYERNEVPIDPEKFSLARWFVDLFRNYNRHEFLSPSYMLARVLVMIAFYGLWRLGRQPFEWYYHYKDPLSSKGDGSLTLGNPEDIRERAKYKSRERNW
jgi:hypothetical protein